MIEQAAVGCAITSVYLAGANLGYFSLMAAAHGFKVSAFEVSMLEAYILVQTKRCRAACRQ